MPPCRMCCFLLSVDWMPLTSNLNWPGLFLNDAVRWNMMEKSETRRENLLLAEQARQFFHHQTQAVRTCLARLEAGEEDPELIHDLRVAARRFTSLSKQTEPFLDPSWCRRAAKIMRPVRKATNRLRDTSVLMGRMATVPNGPAPSRSWTDLADALRREQGKQLEKARRKLLDQTLRQQVNQLDAFLGDQTSTAMMLRTDPSNGDLYVLYSLEGVRTALLFRRTAELLAQRQWIVAESELPAEVLADPVLAAGFLEIAPEIIHRIRLSAKDLRYALEFLAPVLQPEPLAAWLSSFRTLQDQLGTIHDLDLALERIARLEKHGPDNKPAQDWLELCATLKRAWREERQTLVNQLQPQWSGWTPEQYECKIYDLIFQK
ncbi:MAG: CHAD domain-containing protein [Clostridia bacterium]|nr:CHAD domain-containing protein [Clostridia bacterium]